MASNFRAYRRMSSPTRSKRPACRRSKARAIAGSEIPSRSCAKRHPLPGAIETLAASRREEAIPGLVRGLDEDDTRSLAAEGLIRLGRASRSALLAVVAKPADTSSDLRRRRIALSALADIGVAAWQRGLIRPLIEDRDAAVSLQACRALIRSGSDLALCRARLQALLPGLHPPLKETAIALLAPPPAAPEPPPPYVPPEPRRRRPVLHLKRPADQTGSSAA